MVPVVLRRKKITRVRWKLKWLWFKNTLCAPEILKMINVIYNWIIEESNLSYSFGISSALHFAWHMVVVQWMCLISEWVNKISFHFEIKTLNYLSIQLLSLWKYPENKTGLLHFSILVFALNINNLHKTVGLP